MDRAAHESAKGQHPDAVRFEYKELTIPLDLRVDSGSYPSREQLADVEGFEGMIIGYLGTTAQDGWEAAEPLDWDALASAGRFTMETHPSFEEQGLGTTTYKSVTIRLRRPIPAASGT